MNIRLIRHCESEFNASPDGASDTSNTLLKDCGLTEKGKQQAGELIGEYDLIVVSCMRRCRETLIYSKLSALNGNVKIEPLFREIKTDICDFLEDEDSTKLATEEEIIQQNAKIKEYLQNLRSLNTHTYRIAIITHGDLIWNITSHLEEDDGTVYGKWLENGESIDF